jgi:vacuolar-type H+-ATPase subunit F/Vma7
VPETTTGEPRTLVLGERELAIGFRLIGLPDVIEVTPENCASEFQKAVASGRFNLIIASQSIKPKLSESQRFAADSSLRPLVVFVPTPQGEFEVESLNALAKRVLGVSLAVSG